MQISNALIKAVACRHRLPGKTELVGCEAEEYLANAGDAILIEKVRRILGRVGYQGQGRLLLALARSRATCRLLKVPAYSAAELDKMLPIQASALLPYASGQLVTGYEVISVDKEGYSRVNLAIVPEPIINRYYRILKEAGVSNCDISLSSFGIAGLHSYIRHSPAEGVMFVDLDASEAELVLTVRGALVFSRSFSLSRSDPNWPQTLTAEIHKTNEACRKEGIEPIAQRLIFTADAVVPAETENEVSRQLGMPSEALPYERMVTVPPGLRPRLASSGCSFASLIGLSLRGQSGSMGLLPLEEKEARKKTIRYRHSRRLAVVILGIIVVWLAIFLIRLDRKERYLRWLKAQASKVAQQARPLEEAQRKIAFIEGRAGKDSESLEILSQLHGAMPQDTFLTVFGYEAGGPFFLRGEAADLNSVFTLVSKLRESPALRGFTVEVRYATKRKVEGRERVDFEIIAKR